MHLFFERLEEGDKQNTNPWQENTVVILMS